MISVTGQVGNCGLINPTLTASGSFASYLWNTELHQIALTLHNQDCIVSLAKVL